MRCYKRNDEILESINKEFKNQQISANVLQPVPKKLYRYSSVSKYVINDLKADSVSLTNPINFNDDLDSLFQVDNEKTILEEYEISVDIATKAGYAWPQTKEEHIESYHKVNKRYLQFARENSLVKCFSEEPDSRMLWGLYGADNKGICVEYNTSHRIFDHVYPVIYGSQNLVLKGLTDIETDKNITQAIIMASIYKDKEFEHEKEWRVIYPSLNLPSGNDNFVEFKVGIPSEIILGNSFFNKDKRWERGSEDNYIDNYIKLFEIIEEKNITVSKLNYNYREIEIQTFDGNTLLHYLNEYRTKNIDQYTFFEIIERITNWLLI